MIDLRGVSKTVPSGSGTLTILHPLDLHHPGAAGRCHHGSIRQWQVHLARPHCRPRLAVHREDIDRRHRHHRAGARMRLPGCAAGASVSSSSSSIYFHRSPRSKTCSCRWSLRAHGAASRARALLDEVGLSGTPASLSIAALRRRTAARSHCARAVERSAAVACRRTHRKPGQLHRASGDRAAPRHQQVARDDAGARDARPGACRGGAHVDCAEGRPRDEGGRTARGGRPGLRWASSFE